MLTKAVTPRTKVELIEALRRATIRSVEVYENARIASLRSLAELKREGATLIVLR